MGNTLIELRRRKRKTLDKCSMPVNLNRSIAALLLLLLAYPQIGEHLSASSSALASPKTDSSKARQLTEEAMVAQKGW
jgi:hypothetical protein